MNDQTLGRQPAVSVALATYNGAGYLRAQLESIFTQTFSDLEVVVSDDQSTDGTVGILEEYSRKRRLRYTIAPKRLGVIRNFDAAIAMCAAPYIALSDQDDVWLPEKLEVLMKEMEWLKRATSTAMPLLVFCDVAVVTEDLELIHPSLFRFVGKNPDLTTLNRLLLDNVVPGCACLFNRELADLAMPIPDAAMMHDWWLAVVCGAFGKLSYVDRSLMSYRQHGRNVAGANAAKFFNKLARKLKKPALNQRSYTRLSLQLQQAQAQSLLGRFHERLSAEQKHMVSDFICLHRLGFWERRVTLIRHVLFRNRPADIVEMLLRL